MKTNGIFCELDLEMKVRNCFIIVYIRCDYNVFFPHRTVSSARIRNSGLISLKWWNMAIHCLPCSEINGVMLP